MLQFLYSFQYPVVKVNLDAILYFLTTFVWLQYGRRRVNWLERETGTVSVKKEIDRVLFWPKRPLARAGKGTILAE